VAVACARCKRVGLYGDWKMRMSVGTCLGDGTRVDGVTRRRASERRRAEADAAKSERRSATSMARVTGVGKPTKRINKREREYRRYRRSGEVWIKGWVMVIESCERNDPLAEKALRGWARRARNEGSEG